MDYIISIINRNQIPSDMYLCGENDEKDFEYIHLFEFTNGLKYVIGSNNRFYTAEEIIGFVEIDFQIANEYNNNPAELQEYYYNEFITFYKYQICEKIWNYYNNNKELIKQMIDYYKDEEEEEEEIIEVDCSDEGIDIVSDNSDNSDNSDYSDDE
jgi:hypothetical protein